MRKTRIEALETKQKLYTSIKDIQAKYGFEYIDQFERAAFDKFVDEMLELDPKTKRLLEKQPKLKEKKLKELYQDFEYTEEYDLLQDVKKEYTKEVVEWAYRYTKDEVLKRLNGIGYFKNKDYTQISRGLSTNTLHQGNINFTELYEHLNIPLSVIEEDVNRFDFDAEINSIDVGYWKPKSSKQYKQLYDTLQVFKDNNELLNIFTLKDLHNEISRAPEVKTAIERRSKIQSLINIIKNQEYGDFIDFINANKI